MFNIIVIFMFFFYYILINFFIFLIFLENINPKTKKQYIFYFYKIMFLNINAYLVLWRHG